MDQASLIAAMLTAGCPEQAAQAAELLRALPDQRKPVEATVRSRVDGLAALITMAPSHDERNRLQIRFAMAAATRGTARLAGPGQLLMQKMLRAAERFIAGTLSRQDFYRQFPPHRALPTTPGLHPLWQTTLDAIGAGWKQVPPGGLPQRYCTAAVEMARAHASTAAEFDDRLLGMPRQRRRRRIAQLTQVAEELAHAEETAAQRADLERLTTGLLAAMLDR